MAATRNILILSSSTGGGHRSAAEALVHSFQTVAPGQVAVEISEILDEGHAIPRLMGGFYNYLLQRHQNWMKYYYGAINRLRPNESKLLLKWTFEYGRPLWDRFCPDAVVSVHPMTQHFAAYLLRELGLLGRVPLTTVVTDPYAGFWRGWACDAIQQYFVASDAAKQQLLDYGVAARKVAVCGMPVHSKFTPVTPLERRQLRRAAGLDPDKFTVFINAGWAGGGNIPRIYAQLVKADLDIQAVFLGGRNAKLVQEATDLSQGSLFPVQVLAYSHDIHQIMQVSDVMISKCGGLTTFEAMACGLPMIVDAVTPPMPQEEATVRFGEQAGFAITLREAEQVVSIVRRLRTSPNQCESMRQAAVKYGTPGSADWIAREILGTMSRSATGSPSLGKNGQ